jgi:hypothetical protein
MTIKPLSLKRAPIWPYELSIAMFFILDVFSDILSTIWPCKITFAIHLVFLPLADVSAAICPGIGAMAMNFIIVKFSNVSGAICPVKLSGPIFLPVFELSLKLASIFEYFGTFTVLEVDFKLTSVNGTFKLFKCAEATGLVIDPVSFVNISILMYEATPTMGIIFEPISSVLAAIFPHLSAAAFPLYRLIPLS